MTLSLQRDIPRDDMSVKYPRVLYRWGIGRSLVLGTSDDLLKPAEQESNYLFTHLNDLVLFI